MANYVRQSSGDIVTGNTMEASHFNAEFNQLEDAFNGTTGHPHDGTTGNGPKISLTASVSGVLPLANGGTGSSTLTAAEVAQIENIDTVTISNTQWGYLGAATAFGGSLLDDANAAAGRTTLGVVIGTDVQAWDTDLDTYAANPLTAAELGELQNIGATTISATQWGYLGAFDQGLTTSSNVTFGQVTASDKSGVTTTSGTANSDYGFRVTYNGGASAWEGDSSKSAGGGALIDMNLDTTGATSGGDYLVLRKKTTLHHWFDGAGNAYHAGDLQVGTGSAASPSFSFSGDTDTGFFSTGPNQIGVTNNGAESAVFGPTGLAIDNISEKTAAAGITIDGVLIKDNVLYSGDYSATGTGRLLLQAISNGAVSGKRSFNIYEPDTDTQVAPFVLQTNNAALFRIDATDALEIMSDANTRVHNSLLVDTIGEKTAAAGVTIDGVKLKDSNIELNNGLTVGGFLNVGSSAIVTIDGAGSLALTQTRTVVAANTGTADDLTDLTGHSNGDLIILQPDSGDTITVKDGTGNIRLAGGDFIMNATTDRLTLLSSGSVVTELSRSDNN